MVKAIGPGAQTGSESETRIADIQTILIAQAADQLAAPLIMKKDVYILSPIVLDAYGLTVDSSGTLKKKNDANGYRKVTVETRFDKALEDSHEPATNADAVVTTPTGYYEILAIVGRGEMSAVAGDRTLQVTMRETVPIAWTGADIIATSTIALIVSEFGVISLGRGPNHITNVNGVVSTVAAENPLPQIVRTGTTISCKIAGAGKEAGDRAGIFVKQRKVG